MTQQLLMIAIAAVAGTCAAGAVWIAPDAFGLWRASAARRRKLQADADALMQQAKAKEAPPRAK